MGALVWRNRRRKKVQESRKEKPLWVKSEERVALRAAQLELRAAQMEPSKQ